MAHAFPRYRVRLGNDRIIELSPPARIRPEAWDAVPGLPDWTRLEYHQCEHCPLRVERVARCPAAAALAGLVETFAEVISFETVEVEIILRNGRFALTGSAQMLAFGLLVDFVTRAKCPYVFDPTADKGFFLLCLDVDQLLYRLFSGYLVQHHLLSSGAPDPCGVNWDRFQRQMGDAREALQGLLNRVEARCQEDANLNALSGLITVSNFLETHWDESLKMFRDLAFR